MVYAARSPKRTTDPAVSARTQTRTDWLDRAMREELVVRNVARLRGARPAGPPPRPPSERVRVPRRASATGVIVVCGQKIALGRAHAGRTVSIAVSDTTQADRAVPARSS